MGSIANAFSSSIGKKLIMGLTGLFLISFLLVHCFLNAFVFFDNTGVLFNEGAHFMATNWIIRAMEVVLMAGLLLLLPLLVVASTGACASVILFKTDINAINKISFFINDYLQINI